MLSLLWECARSEFSGISVIISVSVVKFMHFEIAYLILDPDLDEISDPLFFLSILFSDAFYFATFEIDYLISSSVVFALMSCFLLYFPI